MAGNQEVVVVAVAGAGMLVTEMLTEKIPHQHEFHDVSVPVLLC